MCTYQCVASGFLRSEIRERYRCVGNRWRAWKYVSSKIQWTCGRQTCDTLLLLIEWVLLGTTMYIVHICITLPIPNLLWWVITNKVLQFVCVENGPVSFNVSSGRYSRYRYVVAGWDGLDVIGRYVVSGTPASYQYWSICVLSIEWTTMTRVAFVKVSKKPGVHAITKEFCLNNQTRT
jgi:hypothetical protein